MEKETLLATHPALADLWEKTEGLSAAAYTRSLAQLGPGIARNPDFLALVTEAAIGSKWVGEFSNIRWLQTAPHIGFTLNDRMLTIIWLSHLGTPGDGPLFIGGCSGVPMSIYTKPGSIMYEGQETNLAPSRYQNALVAHAPSTMIDLNRIKDSQVRASLEACHQPRLDSWMNALLSEQLSAWLGRPVVFFSLNEWARVAISVWPPDDKRLLHQFLSSGINRSLFLSPRRSGKYAKFDTWKSDGTMLLASSGRRLGITEALGEAKAGSLHPTSWLMYALFAYVSGLPVAGSFSFAGYYPGYQTDWHTIARIPAPPHQCIVTTGTHPTLKGKSSWDIWLGKHSGDELDDRISMHELLRTIV